MSTTKKTVKTAPEKASGEVPQGLTARTKCLVNLREKPDLTAKIVRTVEKNTTLKICGVQDAWVQLQDGWMMTEYLEGMEYAEPGKA